jgi:anti-sigma regulatory factor (Ser/Thr protein kinase)
MRRLLTFLFLVTGYTICAQSYLFDTWTSSNGLSVSDINAITQDKLGYLWLATEGGGISRFDGMHFKHYTTNEGLPSDFVSEFDWMGDSVLCLGTEKGIGFYNGLEFTYPDSINESFKQRVVDLCFRRDTLFVAYRHEVAYYFKGKLRTYGDEQRFQNQRVYHFAELNDELYVTCDSGLIQIGTGKQAYKHALNYYFENEQFQLNSGQQGGELWIEDAGLPYLVDTFSISGGIKDAIEWNDKLVFTYGDGIGLVNQDGTFRRIAQIEGLNVDQTKCLFQDDFGNLWVGGYGGLSKWVNPNIQNYSSFTGLQDERVRAILVQQDRIWFGTNSGVEMLDERGYHSISDGSIGVIFKIIEDQFGNLWFATESGLYTYDGFRFKEVGEQMGLADNFVFDVEQTKEGQLVIATESSIYLQNDMSVEALLDESAFGADVVKVDNQGKIWFKTLLGRLGFHDGNKVEFIDTLGGVDLSAFRISSIEIELEEKIWLGTLESGILYWDGQSLDFIDETDGLLSNKIEGLLNIDATTTWVLYENGMQRLSKTNGRWEPVKFYDKAIGFLGSSSYPNSIYWDQVKQRVWAGTKDGAVAVNELEERNNLTQFSPIIQSVDLFFEPTLWANERTEGWEDIPNKLELAYDQNYLTFHFGAIASVNPKRLFYRYKLKNQDENWTLANERFEAIYTDISHGSYEFLLEVSAHSNFSKSKQIGYPINIIPPFYKTIWFWAALAIFFGGLIGWAVRSRINQLNEKMQLRSALAESERKALRLQMNPHFIFNALDSISGFIFKNEPKLAVTYLNNFAKLMRLTLESSRQMLVPLQSEINLIKNYLALEQVRFNNSFDYSIELDEDVDEYVVMLPPMVIQPNLENAILHGLRHKEEHGDLKVHFRINETELVCEIEDNGVGREKAKAKKAEKTKRQGLSSNITQERMTLLSKSMERRFSYKIEDLFNNGEACGTKVVLTFPLIEDDGFGE